MDEGMRNVLLKELGENRFDLVVMMLDVMDRGGNKMEIRAELRKMIEEASDAEGIQTAENRAL